MNPYQIAALERKQQDDEACGEIETMHPGYLGSQDTFYVGNLKGVGRIYQQTFVDTYSKDAYCKLYTTKTPITADNGTRWAIAVQRGDPCIAFQNHIFL